MPQTGSSIVIILGESRQSKPYAVTHSRIAPLHHRQRIPPMVEAEHRMDLHTVESCDERKSFAEKNGEAGDWSQAMIKGSIRCADIRRDRQSGCFFQVLTNGGKEGLAARRADSIRARPKHYRGPASFFRNDKKVHQRFEFAGARIVLNTELQTRMNLIGQRRAHRGARNLMREQANTERPFVLSLVSCPAHGAALAGSKRSAWHQRNV